MPPELFAFNQLSRVQCKKAQSRWPVSLSRSIRFRLRDVSAEVQGIAQAGDNGAACRPADSVSVMAQVLNTPAALDGPGKPQDLF